MASGTATGHNESFNAMALLVSSGADSAPIAKNMCRAFSEGPGESGRPHTTSVLPETSPAPQTTPRTKNAATSGARSVSCEITTIINTEMIMQSDHAW